jgi:methyl-accepting chemotaxis protein
MAEVVEVSLAQSTKLAEVTEGITQRTGEPGRSLQPADAL